MPCCSCTTGSPILSSERSRSMPSTELRFSAVRPGRNAEHAAGRLLSEVLEAGARLRLEPVLGEVVRHGLAPAGGLGGDQHAQLEALQELFQRGKRIVRAPV